MIDKNSTMKILEYFFDYPTKEIHLRELSRELKLSLPTVLKAVSKLKKENLIDVKKGRAVTIVKANLENKNFQRLKRASNLTKLYSCGLVDFLNIGNPQSIICFGSYSRGEDLENSDIDIASIGGKGKSTLKFERFLCRGISVHDINMKKVSEEFKSNLYNGIVLEGAL